MNSLLSLKVDLIFSTLHKSAHFPPFNYPHKALFWCNFFRNRVAKHVFIYVN